MKIWQRSECQLIRAQCTHTHTNRHIHVTSEGFAYSSGPKCLSFPLICTELCLPSTCLRQCGVCTKWVCFFFPFVIYSVAKLSSRKHVGKRKKKNKKTNVIKSCSFGRSINKMRLCLRVQWVSYYFWAVCSTYFAHKVTILQTIGGGSGHFCNRIKCFLKICYRKNCSIPQVVQAQVPHRPCLCARRRYRRWRRPIRYTRPQPLLPPPPEWTEWAWLAWTWAPCRLVLLKTQRPQRPPSGRLPCSEWAAWVTVCHTLACLPASIRDRTPCEELIQWASVWDLRCRDRSAAWPWRRRPTPLTRLTAGPNWTIRTAFETVVQTIKLTGVVTRTPNRPTRTFRS